MNTCATSIFEIAQTTLGNVLLNIVTMMQFTFNHYKWNSIGFRPQNGKETTATHHWQAGTIWDREVTLKTKGKEHLGQLLLR